MRIGRKLGNLGLARLWVLAAAALTAAILLPRGAAASSEQVLYSFCSQTNCADGAYPAAGLIMDGSGNLYGTTVHGGARGYGTVFQLTPTGTGWSENVLYGFCPQGNCADGANPAAGLIMDGSGNLYGTTVGGGARGYGTVFQLTPTGTGWNENVLYSFCPQGNCADGAYPAAGLIMDGSGNLYGTTQEGGAGAALCDTFGCGTVFALNLRANANTLFRNRAAAR